MTGMQGRVWGCISHRYIQPQTLPCIPVIKLVHPAGRERLVPWWEPGRGQRMGLNWRDFYVPSKFFENRVKYI
ncbi:hypothetical protein EAI28_10715 [Faecalicatena contorta]|nr:hypothetical protein [Faecalicatena contorta]